MGRRKALSRSPQPQPTTKKKLKTPPVRVIWVMIIAFFEPLRRASKIRANEVKNMCLGQLLPVLTGSDYGLYHSAIMLIVQAPGLIHVLRDLVYARCVRKCSTQGMQAAFKKALLRCNNKPNEFQCILRGYLDSFERKKKRGKKTSKRRSATATTAPK